MWHDGLLDILFCMEKTMETVLCCARADTMQYYFNEEEYGMIPEAVKDKLKIELVSYCEDAGGIILLAFDEEGWLYIKTLDPIDEIGSELLIKRMQKENSELFARLVDYKKGLNKIKNSKNETREKGV